jgi:hypothetical protein
MLFKTKLYVIVMPQQKVRRIENSLLWLTAEFFLPHHPIMFEVEKQHY